MGGFIDVFGAELGGREENVGREWWWCWVSTPVGAGVGGVGGHGEKVGGGSVGILKDLVFFLWQVRYHFLAIIACFGFGFDLRSRFLRGFWDVKTVRAYGEGGRSSCPRTDCDCGCITIIVS